MLCLIHYLQDHRSKIKDNRSKIRHFHLYLCGNALVSLPLHWLGKLVIDHDKGKICIQVYHLTPPHRYQIDLPPQLHSLHPLYIKWTSLHNYTHPSPDIKWTSLHNYTHSSPIYQMDLPSQLHSLLLLFIKWTSLHNYTHSSSFISNGPPSTATLTPPPLYQMDLPPQLDSPLSRYQIETPSQLLSPVPTYIKCNWPCPCAITKKSKI